MKRYNENQVYNWWSWMKYLWKDVLDKVVDKILDMTSDGLSTLIGVPVITTMIITFGILSLTMLIPHTIEWVYLYLIGWMNKIITDGYQPFVVELLQTLLVFTALVTITPLLLWASPKALYLHIKEKRETKQVRETAFTETDIGMSIEDMILNRVPKPDFLPKKTIKAHSLKDKEFPIFVSPGVYTRETDHSVRNIETERILSRARGRRYHQYLGMRAEGGNYRPMYDYKNYNR